MFNPRTWISARSEDLISQEYLQTQRALHAAPEGYGGKGDRWAEPVLWVAKRFDAASVLDYGCGQGRLGMALRAHELTCRDYDPAVVGKELRPLPADLVTCTDVLEHIEPEKVGTVLKHIRALARKAIFVVVCLRPSNKLLGDGRNAHLLVRSKAWWEAKVDEEGWTLHHCPDLPLPAKLDHEKHWIAVVTP